MAREKIIYKKIEFQKKNFEIFLRPDADESVVAEIFKWQEYRSAEEIISKTVLPILDVGAHIGIFSLYSKALNRTAKIYALEPEEKNFDFLKKNIEANNLCDIKIFKMALAGKTEARKLVVESDSINHHLLPLEDKGAEGEREHKAVSAISLQDFLNKNSIDLVGLLKLDIEGGEYEIFEKLLPEDFARIQNIILEYHNYNGRNSREIEFILRQNGFGVQIFPSRFDRDLGFLMARNKRV